MVDRGDVDAFIEDIDGQDVVDFAGLKTLHGSFALRDAVFTGQRDRAERAAAERRTIERCGERVGLVLSAAEDEAAGLHPRLPIGVEGIQHVVDADPR